MKEESLENFKNIESLEMDINNKKCKSVPIYKNKKFIVFISLIFICITIGVIILLLNKRKSKKIKMKMKMSIFAKLEKKKNVKYVMNLENFVYLVMMDILFLIMPKERILQKM